MHIHFFFRKKDVNGFSIEGIFTLIAAAIQQRNPESKTIEMPFYSHSLPKVFQNIAFARQHQARVNHVTGDVHYTLLQFSRRNLNVLTIHDCGMLKKRNALHPIHLLQKALWFDLPVRKADIVTVISEKTKSELLRYVPSAASKVRVVPNFVNPVFQYVAKTFDAACPTILHIGSTANKNLNRLIEALDGIPCQLQIVGALTEKNLELLQKHRVLYRSCQSISQAELIEHYQKADIVAFVSTYEGFGMPIIEAQSVGRVVVTSNISPTNEVAGKGACLVDPYDVQAIRAGILRVIEDAPLRQQYIEQGLLNVQQYQLERIVGRYCDLYVEGLEQKMVKPTWKPLL